MEYLFETCSDHALSTKVNLDALEIINDFDIEDKDRSGVSKKLEDEELERL